MDAASDSDAAARRANSLAGARDDLHAASESIRDDAERIRAMEAEKDSLDAADPRVAELAREIEEVTRDMAQKATAQRTLIEEIQDG